MKKVNCILIIVILGVAIIGCEKKSSSDIDPVIPFYQDYKVVYKKYKNLTKAKATFREKNKDGIRLELQPPAKILCNGKTSSYSNVGNYFYNWEFSGNANAYFQLTDNRLRVFNNSILFSEINDIGFPESFNTVNLNGTSVLHWTGTPLQEGEFVMAMILQGDKFSGSYFNDTIGSTSLALTYDGMFDLVAGYAEIQLSRETYLGNVSQPDGDAGGQRVILVETKKAIVLN
ncbi:MAG: hypothetical protein K8R37_15760 [Bacteroidales bacterium]|nr:hypothetical protein [Bacteroidales bacterium]